MTKPNSPETVLTDPMLIGIVLEKAKRKHSLLTISVPDINDEFLSVIVDVDDSGKHLYIDELKPEYGNSAIIKKREFTASAKLQGVSIGFRSEIIRTVSSGDQSSYCVKFPTHMHHRERRSSHRVPVAMGLGVVADVYTDQRNPINLRVADLSSDGIGLIACPEDIKKIMRETGKLMCTIYFPEEDDEWTCEIEPCHGHRDHADGQIQLGAQFRELTSKQLEILQKQLRFFDRENMRKLVREQSNT